MQKIPTLYVRNPDDRRHVIVGEVTPGCEWVLAGEGVATRKWDGTCTMLDANGKWWARREVKPGKTTPPGFVAVEHDDTTRKIVGWEPIEQSSFAKYHAEALCENSHDWEPGTYELIGPKVNGNPERRPVHLLVRHGAVQSYTHVDDSPEYLVRLQAGSGWEGVVWHHPDGRMAKLKARDLP